MGGVTYINSGTTKEGERGERVDEAISAIRKEAELWV